MRSFLFASLLVPAFLTQATASNALFGGDVGEEPAAHTAAPVPAQQGDLKTLGKDLEAAGRDIGKAVEGAGQDVAAFAETNPTVQSARQGAFEARDAVVEAAQEIGQAARQDPVVQDVRQAFWGARDKIKKLW
ncbi:MAG: hypothetical protein C0514_05250 [Candidatus Puniceispirillum sp.]|nr:hypothetical protein [Candidatus Puniceispirillum sp.]